MAIIMPVKRQKMPVGVDFGEAIALAARRRWPSNTTGNLAHDGKISKDKAANVLKGHASCKTIAHLFKTLGMDFALEVVEITVGEHLDDHLSRERERAIQREHRINTTREALAQSRARHAALGARLFDRLAG